ncbi:hypothetical protein N7494_013229 [Penicillium frequentans]|uniref:Uncharacterized protein n=1 Tax=Penicillium frequentans TaxID=3151616 RepID=A0AAD6CHE9_9EURO|nr:hypothetical protein N7494_013229 [Penicillium glabrum]
MAKDKRANPQQRRAPSSPERVARPLSGPPEEPESTMNGQEETGLVDIVALVLAVLPKNLSIEDRLYWTMVARIMQPWAQERSLNYITRLQSVNHPAEPNDSGGISNEPLQGYDLDAELDIDHILQQEAEMRNPETN